MPPKKKAARKRSPVAKSSPPPPPTYTVYGANWCNHSKSAFSAARRLARAGVRTRIVDCDKQGCPGVSAYPTWSVGGRKLAAGRTPRAVAAVLGAKSPSSCGCGA